MLAPRGAAVRTSRFAALVSGAAVLAVAGITGVAGPAAAATDTSGITRITVTPSSAATSATGGYCQTYTVTEAGATQATVSIRINLQPTGAVDTQFCTAGGSENPVVGAGNLDTKDFQLEVSSTDTFTFGVSQATSAAGTAAITVYPSNGTNSPLSVSDTATQHFVAGATQNAIVTSLKVSPADQVLTEGTPNATWVVTALHNSDVVGGVSNITGSMTSSEGNPTGQTVTCEPVTDAAGTATCTAGVPVTTAVQHGPYSVTFSVPTQPSSSVSTKATLTTAPRAATGTLLQLICGGKNTLRTADDSCVVPPSADTIAITAIATLPASGGNAGQPAAGIVVDFALTQGAAGTLTPSSCVTNGAGACSIVLNMPHPLHNEDRFVVSGQLSNGASDAATVLVESTFNAPPTNISVTAAHHTGQVGHGDVVTATVTNQFGNPAGAGNEVFFTTTGGVFANGTTSQTVATDLSGRAQIAVSAAHPGAITVTATLQPGSSTPNCSSPADASSGAAAGNCSDSVSIEFVNATVEKPSLNVNSTSGGKVHLSATTHPRLRHVVVRFYRVTASGGHVKIGSARTDASGVAKDTVTLKKGHVALVAKAVGLGSSYLSRYSAVQKVRVKG